MYQKADCSRNHARRRRFQLPRTVIRKLETRERLGRIFCNPRGSFSSVLQVDTSVLRPFNFFQTLIYKTRYSFEKKNYNDERWICGLRDYIHVSSSPHTVIIDLIKKSDRNGNARLFTQHSSDRAGRT